MDVWGDRPLVRLLLGVGLVVAAAGCGDPSGRPAAPAPSEAPPVPSTLPPETASTEPNVPAIAVACGPRQTAESRALVTGQELVFDGTVVGTTWERNPDAASRTAFLDDGREDPGVPPDEAELDDAEAGELWPWTTFAVNGWFTADHGSEIKIWTAGLDLAVGDRMLIAGEAFLTSIPENVAASGMAVVCASAAFSPELDARWKEWFGGSVVPGGDEPEGEADPAAVAEIEAGQDRWNALEPSTYSAVLYVTRDADDAGPCPPTSSLLIVVHDGEVTSAVATDNGCRADPASVPTIDDLFAEAIRAQAAAGEHSYELDPAWGFPTSYYGYDRSIELEGGVSWFHPGPTTTLVGDEITAGLDEMRERWDGSAPASYTFLLDRLCFCGEVGPYTVTVVDGVAMSITNADGTPVRGEMTKYVPGTIDELFDIVASEASAADFVVATFDEASGYPVHVYVDSISNAIDDEVTYVVRELRPTEPLPPSTMPPPTEPPGSTEPQGSSEPAKEVPLTLHVSNQSFADDPVEITVAIDGDEVVHDDFYVESQHNWITFDLMLAPGVHDVTITSDTGVRQTETLRMPRRGQRWAVIDYWYYPPDPAHPGAGETPRSFSFTVDDEPIYFA